MSDSEVKRFCSGRCGRSEAGFPALVANILGMKVEVEMGGFGKVVNIGVSWPAGAVLGRPSSSWVPVPSKQAAGAYWQLESWLEN
jgi:hypothetical protein